MGGQNSGRRPDPVKKLIGFSQPAPTGNDSLYLPNYSGVQSAVLKTAPTLTTFTAGDLTASGANVTIYNGTSAVNGTGTQISISAETDPTFQAASAAYNLTVTEYQLTSGAYLTHAASDAIHYINPGFLTTETDPIFNAASAAINTHIASTAIHYTISEGANITLTPSGTNIEIAASGGAEETDPIFNAASAAINTHIASDAIHYVNPGFLTVETDPIFDAASAAINAHIASEAIHFSSAAFTTHLASTAIHITKGNLVASGANITIYGGTDAINGSCAISVEGGDVELDFLQNAVLNNSLDILGIQAEETLEGGQSANMVRDIFSASGGYLTTVDLINTTASFENETGTVEGSGQKFITQTDYTTIDTVVVGYKISSAKNEIRTDTSGETVYCKLKYTFSDATTGYSDEATSTSETFAEKTYTNPSPTKVVSQIEIQGKRPNGAVTGVQRLFVGYTLLDNVYYTGEDEIIQTNSIPLSITPSNFQIYVHKQELTGTGSITADISFDNGANYQTGLPLDTSTAITDAGDDMILKINLNAGLSSGSALCKGYGVLFW